MALTNPYRLWRRLRALPGGKRAFDLAVGFAVPYTGGLGARVQVLEPGYAKVRLPDHRAVRNHLGSIHAIALANLAEMTGNLALLAQLPDAGNMIVTSFEIEYVKKARGALTAECLLAQVRSDVAQEVQPEVVIRDAAGDVVARARPRCRVRPAAAAPARRAA